MKTNKKKLFEQKFNQVNDYDIRTFLLSQNKNELKKYLIYFDEQLGFNTFNTKETTDKWKRNSLKQLFIFILSIGLLSPIFFFLQIP